MHWFATINLVATVLLLLLAVFIGLRADRRKYISFILLLLAMANYGLGLAFESLSTSLSEAWFWSRVQYLTIPLLPSLLLLVVCRFTDVPIQRPLVKSVLMGCFAFSLLITLLHWSSPWHSLYYLDTQFTRVDRIAAVVFTPGLFYHLFDAFYYVIAVTVLVLVARRAVLLQGLFRAQAVVIFVGIALPWVVALVEDYVLLPSRLDILPMSFVPSALILGYGLLNWGLLGLDPIVMRTVFRAIPSGCIIVDRRRRLLEFNAAAARMFPRLEHLKTGQSIESIYQDMPGFDTVLDTLVESDQWRIWTPENRTHYRVQLTWLEQDKMHLGYLILIQDVTQQIIAETLLRERAELDGLTGVLNRSSFDEQLHQSVEDNNQAGTSLALIFFDLDHFKALNDTQGHQAGDEVLKAVAKSAYEQSRQGDRVARYGGEEFAIILPKTDEAGALVIAERLRSTIAENTPVTASMGIAVSDGNSPLSPQELVHYADQALYQAKGSGRNRTEVAALTASTASPK